MPFPGSLTTITVNIDFTGTSGIGDTGTVSFAPPVDVLYPNFAVLSRTPQVATITNGVGSIVLVTTDNATLNPSSWGYTVTISLEGFSQTYAYTGVGIPSTFGSSVNLANVLPASVPTPITPNTYGVLAQPNTWVAANTFQAAVTFDSTVTFSSAPSIPGITNWYNVKETYGATGNGTTDDTAAIQAALNSASAAGGGVVYFPEGTYKCTPSGSPAIALNMSGMQGVRLVGDNALTTVLMKNGTGTLLNLSGPSTDTSGNTHAKYCGIENLGLNGGTNTGTLMFCYYADNLHFDHVRFKDNYDVVIDTAEFWDSRFYDCVWETSGSTTTPNAIMPNVRLRNSAASSGFGYSTDNVDNIGFVGCRWEDFRNGAVRIEQGAAALNNPNSLFFLNSKMESSFLNGGVHFFTDASSRGIFVDHLYCFSGGFESGFSAAQDVIQLSSAATVLQAVWIGDRSSSATVANGITVNSTNANEAIALRDVHGIYNTAPTGAHINFGTATGGFVIDNVSTNNGTLFAGTVPNVAAQGAIQTFTASGTWTKPPGANLVTVVAIGGGGGGGSGATAASGTATSGGAGGGGGAFTLKTFPASALSSSETVTVGTGGGGGAAVTASSTSGNAGSAGTSSTFKSNQYCIATSGGAGGGGVAGSAATGGSAGSGTFAAGSGASSTSGAAGSNSAAVSQGATGGASGGGVTTGPAATAGGTGGVVNSSSGNAGGTAGTSGGGTGGAGNGIANAPQSGTGGGGGGSATSGTAGSGGAGGTYGAGGGGGGSVVNGGTSGAGGSGSAGIVVVITTIGT